MMDWWQPRATVMMKIIHKEVKTQRNTSSYFHQKKI